MYPIFILFSFTKNPGHGDVKRDTRHRLENYFISGQLTIKILYVTCRITDIRIINKTVI